MTSHINLPDADLHEPKGAATATDKQVYIADGAGSGAWAKVASADVTVTDTDSYYTATDVENILKELRDQDPTGWCYYSDVTYASSGATELDIVSTGSGTQILCDGDTTLETQSPRDMSSSLWNTSTNKIVPINTNDFYLIRLNFTVSTSTGTLNFMEVDLDIGGSQGIIWSNTETIDNSTSESFSFLMPVFTGSTFLSNGGTIYLKKDGSGTLKIQDINILITRVHRGR